MFWWRQFNLFSSRSGPFDRSKQGVCSGGPYWRPLYLERLEDRLVLSTVTAIERFPTLLAMDGTVGAGDNYGWSVAVDGNLAVVGAYEDDEAASGAGAAYVFTGSGANWTQQAKLTASDGGMDDYFGYSVSLDGETIVVGAHREDQPTTEAGAAYVFTRTAGAWTQEQKLIASDGASGDYFGYSVALSGGLLTLFRPRYLILLLPTLAMKFLSSEPDHWGTSYHYNIAFAPVVALAVGDWLSRLRPGTNGMERREDLGHVARPAAMVGRH